MIKPLLEVRDLETCFKTHHGLVRAVDGVSLTMEPQDTLGIVGESGCGKSVLARSIMRLIPCPPGRIDAGQIIFDGRDLLKFSEKKMRQIRGNQISMIFQEPMTALNPVIQVGRQLGETFIKHQGLNRGQALEASVEMLRLVGIPSPDKRAGEYPFQMSGGMRQRVVIAMALACRPKLILADEPTTALDVTIQAQILELIAGLRRELGTSMILITHDLGVISETARRVMVMYAGRVVEQAEVGDLFNRPLHPYTEGLMWSVPTLDPAQHKDAGPLKEIPGLVPDLACLPEGCAFAERCHRRLEVCSHRSPELKEAEPGHLVRCFIHD